MNDTIKRKKTADILNTRLIPIGVPLLAGGALGILLAALVVRESWLLALAVASLVPIAILLNRQPLAALMIWLLLMPFLPFETVGPQVYWVIHRGLIPLALAVVIVSRMLRMKQYNPVRLGWPELSMGVYLAIAAASIVLTKSNPVPDLLELYDMMFIAFAAYWLMRISSPNEQDLKRLTAVLVILCISQILIGFWARYAPDTLPAIWAFERMGTRMSGSFNNPTPYALTLITCMVFIFHYAMNCADTAKRLFLIFVFSLGLLCVFLTFTRGAWGAALITLLALLFLYPKPVLALLSVALVVVVALSASVLTDEVSFALQRLGTQGTVDSRLVLTHAGQEMFYAKPIWGWGFGNYDRYDWQFMERVGNAAPTSWDIQEGTSHNTLLTILAELGITGFIFRMLPFVWWLVLTIRVRSEMPREGFWSWRLLVILWLPIAFYIVSGQVVDYRFFWYHIAIGWLMLGLIASIVEQYREPRRLSASSLRSQRWT